MGKEDLQKNHPTQVKVMYRPFDDRYTFSQENQKGLLHIQELKCLII